MNQAREVEPMLCIYRVKPNQENAFEELLKLHWPTLNRVGLVHETPVVMHRTKDEHGRVTYIETFTWYAGSAKIAHETPEIMRLWEPMGDLCEHMEFLVLESI